LCGRFDPVLRFALLRPCERDATELGAVDFVATTVLELRTIHFSGRVCRRSPIHGKWANCAHQNRVSINFDASNVRFSIRPGMSELMCFLWLELSFCKVFPVSTTGLNTIRVSRSDTLSINLKDKIAIFLSVPRNLHYASNPSSEQYLPITVPEFSAIGDHLSLRLDSSRTKFKFWLLKIGRAHV
jgi:hypothetical protein